MRGPAHQPQRVLHGAQPGGAEPGQGTLPRAPPVNGARLVGEHHAVLEQPVTGAQSNEQLARRHGHHAQGQDDDQWRDGLGQLVRLDHLRWTGRVPRAWADAFQDAGYEVLHWENYLGFVGGSDLSEHKMADG